jgi:hypothetical protein
MNSRNIKKSLNAKMEDWLKHIDDANIVKVIRDNAIITGGAIVSLLTGDEVHDYDVYFRTKESCLAVAEYYVKKFNATHSSHASINEKTLIEEGRIQLYIKSKGVAGEPEEQDESGITDETEPYIEDPNRNDEKPKYRTVFLSTNAISLSDKIQIVTRFYGSPEEIHKNYDFIHCTCWYSFLDNELELPAKALEAIINKELYYVGSRYPLCSIIRTRKFINRGWSINAGQYLKMCLQLNELNLKDLNVFKDQLVGVDSAYFNAAIEQIQEKQTKNPDFQVDNSYLFEVINRIF